LLVRIMAMNCIFDQFSQLKFLKTFDSNCEGNIGCLPLSQGCILLRKGEAFGELSIVLCHIGCPNASPLQSHIFANLGCTRNIDNCFILSLALAIAGNGCKRLYLAVALAFCDCPQSLNYNVRISPIISRWTDLYIYTLLSWLNSCNGGGQCPTSSPQ